MGQPREDSLTVQESRSPETQPLAFRQRLVHAGSWLADLHGSLSDLVSGISGRLFLLTVLFVLIAELMVFIPSLATFYKSYLADRIAAAQIGVLVHRAGGGPVRPVAGALSEDVLARTGAYAVILDRDDRRQILFMVPDPPDIDLTINLDEAYDSTLYCIAMAFRSLTAPEGRTLHVLGSKQMMAESVEVVIPEAAVKEALWTYTINIILLSLLIAGITAALVFAAVYKDLVLPIRRIIQSMTHFRAQPDDASRIIPPAQKSGELGDATRALRTMQTEVFSALQQKSRLAALGTAVSKINHDLRNILASSQLITDRLAASEDPTVARLAPKLVQSIDRAVALCTQTLRYGRVEEAPPELRWLRLHDLVEEVYSSLGREPGGRIALRNEVDEHWEVYADTDHLFRVLLNLARNSIQAMEARAPEQTPRKRRRRTDRLVIRAWDTDVEGTRHAVIEVEDTGPGIPEGARERLFQAFVTTARAGGTGLGLAISRELIMAHGGTLDVVRTGAKGTAFEIILPRPNRDETSQGGPA